MTDAYIYDAVRTPRGKGRKDGALHEVTPVKLAVTALQAVRDRNNLDTHLVDDVVLGCVMPIGEQGANIARTAAVMAGFAEGPAAEAAFLANLDHACRAGPDLVMLIEPLNRYDAPGYFLTGSDQAARLIERAGHANLRLMFDCYHLQIMEGDLTRRLRRHLPIVGHVQIASVPDRGPPDHGEVDYRHICGVLRELGWERPVGAEYKPGGATEDTLGWLAGLGGPAPGSAS